MNQVEKILIELQYLPPIQYYSKMFQYPVLEIEQHENYLKGSYRNRCHIAGPNGLLRLSIPLEKGKNEQQDIRSVRIAYHDNWANQHWNSIKTAYSSAPYFDFYAEELLNIYHKKPTFLFDLNWEILQYLLKHIPGEASIQLSKTYQKEVSTDTFDARNGIFPKKHRQKEDLTFEAKYYPQVFEEKNGFLPNLSILDLLFCYGPQSVLYLESCIIKS